MFKLQIGGTLIVCGDWRYGVELKKPLSGLELEKKPLSGLGIVYDVLNDLIGPTLCVHSFLHVIFHEGRTSSPCED